MLDHARQMPSEPRMEPVTEQPPRLTLQCFGPDGWTTLDRDPLAECDRDEDWLEGANQLGWYLFTRVGRRSVDDSGEASPLRLFIYHRADLQGVKKDGPKFLIELDGNLAGASEFVYALDLPSLMALLASWAPALQATSLAHLSASLPAETVELTKLLDGSGAVRRN